jgi:hypothetical protein
MALQAAARAGLDAGVFKVRKFPAGTDVLGTRWGRSELLVDRR